MPAQQVPLDIDQGATFRLAATLTNPDKTPYDLAGCTARMQIRAAFDADDAACELTTENGRITLGSGGVVNLFIAAVDTAKLTVRAAQGVYPARQSYVYDLNVIVPSGDVQRVMYGVASVTAGVTR